MEKSAVCYEARAAHNVMNGLKHTQEAALVSGVSELILFLRNPPAPLSSDPQLEVTRSIFLFQCSKCKHEEVPCLGAEASPGRWRRGEVRVSDAGSSGPLSAERQSPVHHTCSSPDRNLPHLNRKTLAVSLLH